MSEATTQIQLNLQCDDNLSEEELSELTGQLRREILETDVESVDFVNAGNLGSATEFEMQLANKRRSGEIVTTGALLVTLLASGGVLTTFITALKDWLSSSDKRSITLEINGNKLSLTGLTSEQQDRLIKEWVKHNKKS